MMVMHTSFFGVGGRQVWGRKPRLCSDGGIVSGHIPLLLPPARAILLGILSCTRRSDMTLCPREYSEVLYRRRDKAGQLSFEHDSSVSFASSFRISQHPGHEQQPGQGTEFQKNSFVI